MGDTLLCFSEKPDLKRPLVLAGIEPITSGTQTSNNIFRNELANHKNGNKIAFPMINPDEIAKVIRRDNPNLCWDSCNKQAAEEAQKIREVFAQAQVDFGFETVGSHPSKVEFLKQIKDKGYSICILFVSTENPEINVRRVKERHRSGGHDVPPEKVRSRYARTMTLFPEYYEVADFMAVYDNSEERERNDGFGPKLLLVKRGGNVMITKDGRESLWLGKFIDLAI